MPCGVSKSITVNLPEIQTKPKLPKIINPHGSWRRNVGGNVKSKLVDQFSLLLLNILNMSEEYRIDMISTLKQHFSKKENLLNWIFYFVGFGLAWYGYGLKAALLLVLFAISVIVLGLTIAEIFTTLKSSNSIIKRELFFSIGISLTLLLLDFFLLKLEIILYVTFLSFFISFMGIYFGIKPRN